MMANCQLHVTDDLPTTKAGLSPYNGHLIKRFSFLNDQVCNTSVLPEQYLGTDDQNYSQAWYTHYHRREHIFKPWSVSLGTSDSKWEVLRLQAINNYWRAAKSHRISPVTIHLAVWLLNKLLWSFSTRLGKPLTEGWFAGIVVVALRIALKFEERPETLWGIRRIWDIIPILESWNIDRSDQFLMKVESEALRILDDCLDAPLSVQFFDKYLSIGGWPADVMKDYTSLGHFLLALATFAGGENNPLQNISPSKLAASAVVLSVKIVNGDSRNSYEFFPERFAAFCQLSLKDLQPAIKGLSSMLRKKPEGSGVLARIYQEWGEHDWQ